MFALISVIRLCNVCMTPRYQQCLRFKKTAWMDRKALTDQMFGYIYQISNELRTSISKYLSSLMHQTLKVDSYFSKNDKLQQVNNIMEKGSRDTLRSSPCSTLLPAQCPFIHLSLHGYFKRQL